MRVTRFILLGLGLWAIAAPSAPPSFSSFASCEDAVGELNVSYGPSGTVIRKRPLPPVPVVIERSRKAPDVQRRDRVLDELAQEGFKILNPQFASGAEGFVATVITPQGKKAFVKVGRREAEALAAEQAVIAQVRTALAKQGRESAVPATELVRPKGGAEVPVMVMELIARAPGTMEAAPTLRERLDLDPEKLTLDQRIGIVNQLAEVMAAAHSIPHADAAKTGIMHRDLKPENLLVDDAGNLYVIDWGLSARPGEYPAGVSDNSVSGTYNYMDASQLLGKPSAPSNDVEAARRIAWEVLGAGTDLETHTLWRMAGTIPLRDFKYAPEIPGVPRPLAVAVWDRSAKDMKEYYEGIRNAQTMPETEFYNWYGNRLAAADSAVPRMASGELMAPNAARAILESKSLIANFPDGLGFTPEKTQEVIRAAEALKKDAQGTLRYSGPHMQMHFGAFEARLREIEKAKEGAPKGDK